MDLLTPLGHPLRFPSSIALNNEARVRLEYVHRNTDEAICNALHQTLCTYRRSISPNWYTAVSVVAAIFAQPPSQNIQCMNEHDNCVPENAPWGVSPQQITLWKADTYLGCTIGSYSKTDGEDELHQWSLRHPPFATCCLSDIQPHLYKYTECSYSVLKHENVIWWLHRHLSTACFRLYMPVRHLVSTSVSTILFLRSCPWTMKQSLTACIKTKTWICARWLGEQISSRWHTNLWWNNEHKIHGHTLIACPSLL